MLVPFYKLCLGGRFWHPEMGEHVWVKIGYNTIAECDVSQITTHWVGQKIRSFAEADSGKEFAIEVEVVE
jgi:hypothetical protein